jgi:hypothetical protein
LIQGWQDRSIRGGMTDRHRSRKEFEEGLEKTTQAAIEESRMVLPGIQALFGFQLIAVFNQGFRESPASEQHMHYGALVLVALSVAIIMTPAAYHRIVEVRSVSIFLLRLISTLIAAAMLPLMIALCLDIYLVGFVIFGDRVASAILAGAVFLVFLALWFAFPLMMRMQHRY